MGFKEKIIGLVLIGLGVIPFLFKISSVSKFFTEKKLLFLMPGEIIYQVIIIALGVALIWKLKARVEKNK
jgi:hypothetical protein